MEKRCNGGNYHLEVFGPRAVVFKDIPAYSCPCCAARDCAGKGSGISCCAACQLAHILEHALHKDPMPAIVEAATSEEAMTALVRAAVHSLLNFSSESAAATGCNDVYTKLASLCNLEFLLQGSLRDVMARSKAKARDPDDLRRTQAAKAFAQCVAEVVPELLESFKKDGRLAMPKLPIVPPPRTTAPPGTLGGLLAQEAAQRVQAAGGDANSAVKVAAAACALLFGGSEGIALLRQALPGGYGSGREMDARTCCCCNTVQEFYCFVVDVGHAKAAAAAGMDGGASSASGAASGRAGGGIGGASSQRLRAAELDTLALALSPDSEPAKVIHLCGHCVHHAVPAAVRAAALPECVAGSDCFQRMLERVSVALPSGQAPLLAAQLADERPRIVPLTELLRQSLVAIRESGSQAGAPNLRQLSMDDVATVTPYAEAVRAFTGSELAVELSNFDTREELSTLLDGCLGDRKAAAGAVEAARGELAAKAQQARARWMAACSPQDGEPPSLRALKDTSDALILELRRAASAGSMGRAGSAGLHTLSAQCPLQRWGTSPVSLILLPLQLPLPWTHGALPRSSRLASHRASRRRGERKVRRAVRQVKRSAHSCRPVQRV
jgi:hypothetical protein